MKNLFDPSKSAEITNRIAQLTPASARQWGTMSAAQMLAHCSNGVEMAMGEILPKRVFLGRVLGPIIKPLALKNDDPMRRNSPTAKEIVVADDRDLPTEQARLIGLLNRFAAAGPPCCTTHPHAFFGPLTPDQWAILMYKHLDHHLRQFSV
jgi:Protein of unknown function (DUF1569)